MNNLNDKILILIPAYLPDQRLITLIDGLYEDGFTHQLIIDDGSGKECEHIFRQVQERKFCTLLTHKVNMGKGQALKTGLAYFCEQAHECSFVLMADADGQHDRISIQKVALALENHPDSLILGVRNFSQKHVPLHNKLGNNITKAVISLFLGKPISDTQTGLRAMNRQNARQFLDLQGQRYEYEINMLLECKSRHIDIFEVEIKTIYINKNETSHFNPLIDSTKIYWQIIKYSLSSGISTLIDLGLFTFLANLWMGQKYYIFFSTLIARLVSLGFNYYANKKAVFQSKKPEKTAILKYIILCSVNILCATWLTDLLINLLPSMKLLIIKIIVSAVLFIANFFLQKKWIF